MDHIELIGLTSDALVDAVVTDRMACERAVWAARNAVRQSKREVTREEAMILAHFAMKYGEGSEHGEILEIGTALGYSAATMGFAAPDARVTTLNPKENEFAEASGYLAQLDNVFPVCKASWDYLGMVPDRQIYDLIFVDGDHDRVALDLPWFARLQTGGLMLFHDFTPPTAKYRPCGTVYNIVWSMAEALGRDPDVLLVDHRDYGMAGFVRGDRENLAGLQAMADEVKRG